MCVECPYVVYRRARLAHDVMDHRGAERASVPLSNYVRNRSRGLSATYGESRDASNGQISQAQRTTRPITSKTTAITGNVPWVNAARALSGADASSTTAAAAMDPTPAKMSAAPTAVVPQCDRGDADSGDDRQEKVVEALVEREQLGGFGFLGRRAERRAGARLVQVSDSIVKM